MKLAAGIGQTSGAVALAMMLGISAGAAQGSGGAPMKEIPVLALKSGSQTKIDAENGILKLTGYAPISGMAFYSVNGAPASLTPPILAVPRANMDAFTMKLRIQNNLGCSYGIYASASEGPDHARPSDLNTHTHGLQVSPHSPAPFGHWHGAPGTTPPNGVYGDFVGVQMSPAKCQNGNIKDFMEHEIIVPKNHVSGQFWVHPHVHGFSGTQVSRGLSTLLTIGGLENYPDFQDRTATNIMLKDFQISRMPSGSSWSFNDLFDPLLCSNSPTRKILSGRCWNSAAPNKRWLFTVNGDLFPKATIADLKGQAIWRIANMSANVTHRVQFEVMDNKTGKFSGKCMFVRVLGVDGVPVKADSTLDGPASICDKINTPGAPPVGDGKSIVMMPAGRADIFLSKGNACNAIGLAGAACDAASLTVRMQTAGLFTGSAAGVGDEWPAMNLATVVFNPTTGAAPGAIAARTAMGTPTARAALFAAVTPQQCIDGSGKATTADTLSAVDRSANTGTYRWIGLNIVASPTGLFAGKSDFRMFTSSVPRQVSAFSTDAAFFGPAGISESDYKNFDHMRIDACVGAKFGHDPIEGRDVYEEDWVVFNASDELHNFHIHQTKFSIISVWNPEYNLPGNAAFRNSSMTPGVGFHDTFPVPIHGAVHIKIRFYPESVGTFVYHCHILEHEDGSLFLAAGAPTNSRNPAHYARGGGMMSVIEVKDLGKPTAAVH